MNFAARRPARCLGHLHPYPTRTLRCAPLTRAGPPKEQQPALDTDVVAENMRALYPPGKGAAIVMGFSRPVSSLPAAETIDLTPEERARRREEAAAKCVNISREEGRRRCVHKAPSLLQT